MRVYMAVVVVLMGSLLGLAAIHAASPFLWLAPRTLDQIPGATSRVAVDGDVAAWIAVTPINRDEARVDVKVRRLDAAAAIGASLVPQPHAVMEQPFAWLTGGPVVVGDVVALSGLVEVDGRTQYALWAVPAAPFAQLARISPTFIGDVSGYGHTLVWADGGSGDLDIFMRDLATGVDLALVELPGDQWAPALSETWLVWLDAPEGRRDDVRLMARRRTGGPPIEVTASAWPVAPVLDGARLLWVGDGPEGDGAALYLHDLDQGVGGVLAVRSEPCPGCGPDDWFPADLSSEAIVRSLGAVPGAGELIVHDVRALTSVANVGTYLTGFMVAETTTAAARPAVSDSRILWAEPDPRPTAARGERVQMLALSRHAIYVPMVTCCGHLE